MMSINKHRKENKIDYKGKLILAKEALESGSYDKETIEYIFPELKESEDERIRKAIVKMISDIDGGFPFEKYGIIKKEAITWLEKQCTKEPKKTSIWKHWNNGIAGNGASKTIYLIKNGNDYSLSSVLGHECDYVLLSDLDKLMLSEKQGEKSHCNGEVNDEALQQQLQIWFDKGKCSGRDEVIFHPEDFGLQKQGEQKPADNIIEEEKPLLEKFKQAVYDCAWGKVTCKVEGESKEEYANRWAEQILTLVRDWADDYIDSREDAIRRHSFDKGKQSIQNPAWSEEDERRMQQIISDLEQCTVPGFPIYIGGIELEINWLKSLKERMI